MSESFTRANNAPYALRAVVIYIRFDMITVKPLYWLGDSLDQVREFAPLARERIGFELCEVQQGNEPTDWKPVSTIGPGANEIRIHANCEYRVLYVAKFAHAVYVLHAFAKKTRQTSKRDIDWQRHVIEA
jgi:phage-related protein